MRRRALLAAMLIALLFPYGSKYGKSAVFHNTTKPNKSDMARLRKAILRAREQAGFLQRTISKYKHAVAGKSEAASLKLLRYFHNQDLGRGDFLELEGLVITPAELVFLSTWVEQ